MALKRSNLLAAVMIVPVLYAGSYFVKSRCGMLESIEIGRGRKPAIWTFDGCRQEAHFYFEGEYFDKERVEKGKKLFDFYRPLVRIDRLLGNYHLLDDNC